MLKPAQSVRIDSDVMGALQTEYEKMRKVLLDDARIINEDIKSRVRQDDGLNEEIKSTLGHIQNSIYGNNQLLRSLEYRIGTIERKLDMFQNSGVQTQESEIDPRFRQSHPDYSYYEKQNQNKFKVKPRHLVIFLVVVIIGFAFYSLMPADKTSQTANVSESSENSANGNSSEDISGTHTDTLGNTIDQQEEKKAENQLAASTQSKEEQQQSASDTQPEKSLADLEKEHETYAKALIHIAQDQNAPEHSKLKDLTTNISKADGLDDTTNSIISEPQKKRFASFEELIKSEWHITHWLTVGAFEYIAAIKCSKDTVCSIRINLDVRDITTDVLTNLNKSLPESVSFESVPQKYNNDKKADGFTNQFQEFMAAVVLAHIMQEDKNP